mgnify:FL=1
MISWYKSTAVSLDGVLHLVALHADVLSVLTSIHTEGNEEEWSCSQGQADAPAPGHTAGCPAEVALTVLSAVRTFGAFLAVAWDIDNGGSWVAHGRHEHGLLDNLRLLEHWLLEARLHAIGLRRRGRIGVHSVLTI